jgi:HSP20 family protein
MNTAITRNSSYPGLLGRTVFDDVFDSFFTNVPAYVQKSTQGYPVADIYSDDEGNTIMEFALAGFLKEDLLIEVKPEDRTLTVAAAADEGKRKERRIARRSFKKTYVNYDDHLDLAKAEAQFENGLLSIKVPKRPETKPVAINIM